MILQGLKCPIKWAVNHISIDLFTALIKCDSSKSRFSLKLQAHFSQGGKTPDYTIRWKFSWLKIHTLEVKHVDRFNILQGTDKQNLQEGVPCLVTFNTFSFSFKGKYNRKKLHHTVFQENSRFNIYKGTLNDHHLQERVMHAYFSIFSGARLFLFFKGPQTSGNR